MKAEYGFLNNGTLANYIVVPSRNAVAIPSKISNVQAAPIACSIATAVHAAKLAQVNEGDWCVIYGVNGVGLSLLQLLKREYGAKVMAITRDPVRRKRALELGADGFVDSLYASEVANLARSIIPDGADVVFECVGRRETLDACVGWQGVLGRRGRLILIGYASGEEHDFVCHPLPLIVKEQSVIGSCGATLEDVNEAIQYVSDGVIETTVDSQVPMEKFQKALDRIENCECTGKIVCIP
jgi:propanol-preferring alcohol dehydrogenase